MLLFIFRLFLETFKYSPRIKPLFRQKLFLKRSKKNSMCVVCQTSSQQARSLFRFSAKKNSSKSVLSLRIPMCRKIKHLRRRQVGQESLSVILIPTFPIIFPSRTLFDK